MSHAVIKPLYPSFICQDGFSMSVQASAFHYCEPRNDEGPYSSVEIGFPSEVEPLLMDYIDVYKDDQDPRESVYPRVPADVVLEVIAKHGGPGSGASMENLPLF